MANPVLIPSTNGERSASITVINDFQRGRLPHYVAPPELKDDNEGQSTELLEKSKVEGLEQEIKDLENIGDANTKSGKAENEINEKER